MNTPVSTGRVYIDNRERGRIGRTIKYFGEENTEIQQLKTGDFQYSKDRNNDIDVAVEFKTAPDMISSIIDKRVFRQVKRMRTEFPNHRVLVLGNPVNHIDIMQKKAKSEKWFNFDFTLDQWFGAYTSLEQVTKVEFANNFRQCLQLMDLTFKKCTDEKNRSYLYNEKPSENTVVNYLSNVQGIGLKTAELVCEELSLNSLEELLGLQRDDLLSIKGIGVKTTDLIIGAVVG